MRLGLHTVEEGTVVLAGAALGAVTSGERLLSTGVAALTITVEATAAVAAGMQIPLVVMGVGMVVLVLLVHGTNIPFILKSLRYNFDRDGLFTIVGLDYVWFTHCWMGLRLEWVIELLSSLPKDRSV